MYESNFKIPSSNVDKGWSQAELTNGEGTGFLDLFGGTPDKYEIGEKFLNFLDEIARKNPMLAPFLDRVAEQVSIFTDRNIFGNEVGGVLGYANLPIVVSPALIAPPAITAQVEPAHYANEPAAKENDNKDSESERLGVSVLKLLEEKGIDTSRHFNGKGETNHINSEVRSARNAMERSASDDALKATKDLKTAVVNEMSPENPYYFITVYDLAMANLAIAYGLDPNLTYQNITGLNAYITEEERLDYLAEVFREEMSAWLSGTGHGIIEQTAEAIVKEESTAVAKIPTRETDELYDPKQLECDPETVPPLDSDFFSTDLEDYGDALRSCIYQISLALGDEGYFNSGDITSFKLVGTPDGVVLETRVQFDDGEKIFAIPLSDPTVFEEISKIDFVNRKHQNAILSFISSLPDGFADLDSSQLAHVLYLATLEKSEHQLKNFLDEIVTIYNNDVEAPRISLVWDDNGPATRANDKSSSPLKKGGDVVIYFGEEEDHYFKDILSRELDEDQFSTNK